MTTIRNLTPHAVQVLGLDGSLILTLAPEATPARVAFVPGAVELVDGVPVEAPGSYGALGGLPEPVEGVLLVCSLLVAQAAKRADVVSPGDLVRDEKGQPKGCKGLRRQA